MTKEKEIEELIEKKEVLNLINNFDFFTEDGDYKSVGRIKRELENKVSILKINKGQNSQKNEITALRKQLDEHRNILSQIKINDKGEWADGSYYQLLEEKLKDIQRIHSKIEWSKIFLMRLRDELTQKIKGEK